MRKKITILTLLFCSFVTGLFANTPQYDICIYGESASGVIAAIQGARMGKKVVLISKNDHVGGLVTSGLTATDMNRNDLIGGITKEFYNKIYNYYLQPEVWHNQDRESFMVSTLKRTYRGKNDERQIQWVYESSVAERIMRDMLKMAGVEILFNHRLDLNKNVRKEENIIRSIQLENGKVIEAKMFIDASYEGDLLARAGVSYTVGRESNLQYGETYNGIRLNYKQGKDLTKISPYIKEGNVKSGALPYVTDREKISDCIERIVDYAERSLPVLNEAGKLMGIITSSDVVELVDDEMSDDYAKLGGLTGEEDLRESVFESVKKRLPWLTALLFLGMLVSSVVGAFESVVAVLPVVICFQSMVLDMAGNVGTQSLAVTIRVLVDENLTVSKKFQLLWKEVRVGLLNGTILAVMALSFLGCYIHFFKGYAWNTALLLSGCVGASLVVAMVVSSLVGTLVPMLFHKIHIDPAVASGPLITTINDLVAVVVYYGLAMVVLIDLFHLA